MLTKSFKVDNLKYEFTVIQNTISFAVISGTSKRGIVNNYNPYDFFGDLPVIYDDINLCLSPFKVLKKVSALTLEWIRNKSPYMFSFYTSSEKKQKIFNILIKKIFKNNQDINRNYYLVKNQHSEFIFYRRNKTNY